jgi:hypothetical protein
MNRILRSLASAVGLFVVLSPELALAQSDGAAFDMAWPPGPAAMSDTLPPAEILAEARREGFYPIGRPVQRGHVYVLFAVDQDDMDVKLTVDAASGRVLWVAGAVAHFGGPGSYGYRSIWRSERPAVPPSDVPDAGPTEWDNSGSAGIRHHASTKGFPPLPRIRPASLASAAARDDAPEAATAVQPAVPVIPVAPLE